jgi:hypothetical protein
MKTKLEETKADITISDGEALGDGFKCFNLPNNNCGIVKQDKKIMLCRDGAGKKHEECKTCADKYKCEHIHFCCGATIICNNRCYQNNTLTLDTGMILYKNYLE